MLSEKDRQTVVDVLNLEYGANRRYQYQIQSLSNPRINALLEGVLRNEGDHVEEMLSRLKENEASSVPGFATILLHLKLNLEFEQFATKTYARLMKEAENEGLRDIFRELARGEAGHVSIFKHLIEEIEQGKHPVLFYCPTCGWELDYGLNPEEGKSLKCPRCGVVYELYLEKGDFTLRRK